MKEVVAYIAERTQNIEKITRKMDESIKELFHVILRANIDFEFISDQWVQVESKAEYKDYGWGVRLAWNRMGVWLLDEHSVDDRVNTIRRDRASTFADLSTEAKIRVVKILPVFLEDLKQALSHRETDLHELLESELFLKIESLLGK